MIYKTESVLPIVKANPGETASELKRKIQGADRKSVNQTLYHIAKFDLVKRSQAAKEAPTWEITEKGLEWLANPFPLVDPKAKVEVPAVAAVPLTSAPPTENGSPASAPPMLASTPGVGKREILAGAGAPIS